MRSSLKLAIHQRIAVGTSKLSFGPSDGTFPSVIATAIQNHIDTFEATLHKEEEMRRAMTDAIMYLNDKGTKVDDRSIKVIGKIGYRIGNDRLLGDVLQEHQNESSSVFHNLSQDYINNAIQKSPLIKLFHERKETDLILLAQNPEAQGANMLAKGAPVDDVRSYVKEQLLEAFTAMEIMSCDRKIGSYGVCSNGLSLPSSHPLHLSWKDIFLTASMAMNQVHGIDSNRVANLSTLQLPVNLLETRGVQVANEIKQYVASLEKKLSLPSSIKIHSTRPLTCYLDGGTGSEHILKLIDTKIPITENDSEFVWTNQIKKMPTYYTTVLNETMSHFDASHLIEIKTSGERPLTMEERETLDGCKLLSSMLHDLDVSLTSGNIMSFADYEKDLYTKVVPLIHDNFEELDEQTADLLQRFFQAHANAVRFSIAKNTRNFLVEGENGVQKYEIPATQTMQEFAIRFLIHQQSKGPFIRNNVLFDRVVVGCPRVEHVIEAISAADRKLETKMPQK